MNATQTDSRLAPLDALRGLAILGVIAVHVSEAVSTGVRTLDMALGWGRFGVQLFFVVSAFTMFHMWRLREDEPQRIRNFYIRRFLRIAPPFWLAIPVYLALLGTGPGYWAPQGIGPTEIVLTATFLHALWPSAINSVVPGGWSIGVEMMFYAVFPLIALRVRRPQALVWLAVAASLANQAIVEPALRAWLLANYHTPSTSLVNEFLYLAFPSQLPVFLLGGHLFHVYRLPLREWSRAVLPAFALWAAGIALLRFLGVEQQYKDPLPVFALLYLTATLVLRTGFGPALLALPGRYSYGIYLCHFIVLQSLGTLLHLPRSGAWPWLLMFVATTVASTLVAMVLHRVIERPAARLAKALTSRRRRPDAAPQPAN